MARMTKKKADALAKAIFPKIQAAGKELGVEIERGAGRYDPDAGTLAFRIELKLPVEARETTNTEHVKYGLCKRGDKVIFQGRPDAGRVAIIDKARRTKYAFHFEDEPEKGYLAKFTAFTASQPEPGTPQANAGAIAKVGRLARKGKKKKA